MTLPRYRKVYPRLFQHPSFVALDDGDRNACLYLIAGPQSNRCGLYRVSLALAAEDWNLASSELARARVERVCAAFDWQFDEHARVFFLPSHWRWNPPENQNVLLGALRDLADVPTCELLRTFASHVRHIPLKLVPAFRKALAERLSDGFWNHAETVAEPSSHGSGNHAETVAEPSPIQEQEQEQEQEKQERAPSALARSMESEFPSALERRRTRSNETDDGKPAVAVLTGLAVKEMAEDLKSGDPDEPELRERLKSLAAKANLRYDGHSVGEAIDQALVRTRRRP